MGEKQFKEKIMTILNVRNALITHFLSNDTFNVITDTAPLKISGIKESDHFVMGDANALKDMMRCALKQLEAADMVSGIGEEKNIYILNSPINEFAQKVEISPSTAEMIATIVNNYCEANGIDENTCDKMNIDEHDIVNVGIICQKLLDTITNIRKQDQKDGEGDYEADGGRN